MQKKTYPLLGENSIQNNEITKARVMKERILTMTVIMKPVQTKHMAKLMCTEAWRLWKQQDFNVNNGTNLGFYPSNKVRASLHPFRWRMSRSSPRHGWKSIFKEGLWSLLPEQLAFSQLWCVRWEKSHPHEPKQPAKQVSKAARIKTSLAYSRSF